MIKIQSIRSRVISLPKVFLVFIVCLLLSLVTLAKAEMTKEDLELVIKQQARQIEELKSQLSPKTNEPEEERQAFLQKQWQLEQEYRQRGLERANQAQMLDETKKLRRAILLNSLGGCCR